MSSEWAQLLNTGGLVLLAFLGIYNRRAIKTLEVQIDGRLDELLELTKKSSHAEGVKDEKERKAIGKNK